MKGVTHQLFATSCVGLALSSGLYDQSLLFAFPVAAAGALLPDMDDPRSKLGHKLGPISELINQFAGHRHFFHSLPFLAVVAWLAWMLNQQLPIVPGNLWLSFVIGVGSHLLGDMFFGRSGVRLFWPMTTRIRLLPECWSVGGVHEVVFNFCCLAATALFSGVIGSPFGFS